MITQEHLEEAKYVVEDAIDFAHALAEQKPELSEYQLHLTWLFVRIGEIEKRIAQLEINEMLKNQP